MPLTIPEFEMAVDPLVYSMQGIIAYSSGIIARKEISEIEDLEEKTKAARFLHIGGLVPALASAYITYSVAPDEKGLGPAVAAGILTYTSFIFGLQS